MFAYKRQFEMLKITNIVIGNLFSNEEKSNNKIAHFCIQWLIIFLGDSFIHFFIVFPFISFSTETHLILHSENAATKVCLLHFPIIIIETVHTTHHSTNLLLKRKIISLNGFLWLKKEKRKYFLHVLLDNGICSMTMTLHKFFMLTQLEL